MYVVHQVLTNCYSYRKFLSQPTCAWARWQYFERACLLPCCWAVENERLGSQGLLDTLTGPSAACSLQEVPAVPSCPPASKPTRVPPEGRGGFPARSPVPPGPRRGPRRSGSAPPVVLGAYEAGPAALTASSLGVRLAGEEGAVGLGATSWRLVAACAWVVLVSFSFESQDLEAGTRAFVKWKPSPLV